MTNRSDQIKTMYVCIIIIISQVSHSLKTEPNGRLNTRADARWSQKANVPTETESLAKTSTTKGPALPGRVPR